MSAFDMSSKSGGPKVPVVALNGNVDAREAASILGCSYPHIINLLKKGKIKGRLLNKHWFVDAEDVYRAKATHLVVPRKKRLDAPTAKPEASKAVSETRSGSVKIQLEVDQAKFDLIKLAFSLKDTTLVEFLNGQLDGVYEQVKSKLSGLTL